MVLPLLYSTRTVRALELGWCHTSKKSHLFMFSAYNGHEWVSTLVGIRRNLIIEAIAA